MTASPIILTLCACHSNHHQLPPPEPHALPRPRPRERLTQRTLQAHHEALPHPPQAGGEEVALAGGEGGGAPEPGRLARRGARGHLQAEAVLAHHRELGLEPIALLLHQLAARLELVARAALGLPGLGPVERGELPGEVREAFVDVAAGAGEEGGHGRRANRWRSEHYTTTMALALSHMMALGTEAPDFTLPDTAAENAPVNLRTYATGAGATLVTFICNHCPYVIHVVDELVAAARAYQGRGLRVVAISSNDVARYPQDGPAEMAAFAETRGFTFPYVYDESQEVARAYDAACTPDFFLFDADLRLAYRGRLDASRPGNDAPVDGADLRAALDRVLAGEAVPEAEQVPSAGCSIKWLP